MYNSCFSAEIQLLLSMFRSKGQLSSPRDTYAMKKPSFHTLPSNNECTCTFTLLREVPNVPNPTIKQDILQGDLWPSMCSLPESLTLAGTLLQGPKRNAKVSSMANRLTKGK